MDQSRNSRGSHSAHGKVEASEKAGLEAVEVPTSKVGIAGGDLRVLNPESGEKTGFEGTGSAVEGRRGKWECGMSLQTQVAQSYQYRMSTNGAGDGCGKAAARKIPAELKLGPHRLHASVMSKGL